jgi:hypothetical protein
MPKRHDVSVRRQAKVSLGELIRVKAALGAPEMVLEPALDLVPPDSHSVQGCCLPPIMHFVIQIPIFYYTASSLYRIRC